jgi:DNA-binding response OmpR family regulator
MARILSISYSPSLLQTRELLLEQMGHTVVSAEGCVTATEICETDQGFDLIILGHTVPHKDKLEIIRKCGKSCTCPILALLRPHETVVEGAARSIESDDPKAFVAAIHELAPR